MSNGPNQHLVTLVAGVLAGIAGIAATIYALGVLTVGVSIRATYADTWALAWYAASLMPKTTVAVYGFASLLWPTLAGAALIVLFVVVGYPLYYNLAGLQVTQLKLVQWVGSGPFWQRSIPKWVKEWGIWRRRIPRWVKGWGIWQREFPGWAAFLLVGLAGVIIFIGFLAMIYQFSTVLPDVWTNTRNDFVGQEWAGVAYVFFTVLGGVAGGAIVRFRGLEYGTNNEQEDKKKFIPTKYKAKPLIAGFLIIYVLGWIGALFLAEAKLPPLPHVVLVQYVEEDENKVDESKYSVLQLEEAWRAGDPNFKDTRGWLLAEQQGNWYILAEDTCNHDEYNRTLGQNDHDLLVIPKDEKLFLTDIDQKASHQTLNEKFFLETIDQRAAERTGCRTLPSSGGVVNRLE